MFIVSNRSSILTIYLKKTHLVDSSDSVLTIINCIKSNKITIQAKTIMCNITYICKTTIISMIIIIIIISINKQINAQNLKI